MRGRRFERLEVGQISCMYQRLTSSKALVIGMLAKGPLDEGKGRRRETDAAMPHPQIYSIKP